MGDSTSGGLLRSARTRAGLTQTELASRAGVAQSVISAYESGHRQPALTTLTALVSAAGFDVDLRLRRAPANLARLSGPIGVRVRRHRRELRAVSNAHGVTNLRVFGSVARGEERPDSDLDLLADIPTGLGLLGLGRLQEELESLLGCRVDLVGASDLKPAVRCRVEADLVGL